MKITKDLKLLFLGKFRGRDFTREEVEKFLEPYFDFDPEKAYKEALAKAAQKLIASFKDSDNIRDCFSYEWEGENRFGWPLFTNEVNKLEMMEKRNQKQKQGIEKSLAKIQARIWILKHQITIFDFLEYKKQKGEKEA